MPSDTATSSSTHKSEDLLPSTTSLSYRSSFKRRPPLPSSATSHRKFESLKLPIPSDTATSSSTHKSEDPLPSTTSLSYRSSFKRRPPLPSSATSHKKFETSSTTITSKKAPTSTTIRSKKAPTPSHSKSYNKCLMSVAKPSSKMSFCDSPFADSIEGTIIPSFTGPVSSSFLGSTAYNSIDLMSSSDEGCSDTMPNLVDPCAHPDSSSDEDSLDITIENKAKATRRSTRIPPTVLLPSYFEVDDDDDGEVYDDEDETVFAYPPPFGTNRVKSYAKVRKRSKKVFTTLPKRYMSGY
jgi:hypothetical protein